LFNQLEGHVPLIKQFATFPKTFHEWNIRLCVFPLKEKYIYEEPRLSFVVSFFFYLNRNKKLLMWYKKWRKKWEEMKCLPNTPLSLSLLYVRRGGRYGTTNMFDESLSEVMFVIIKLYYWNVCVMFVSHHFIFLLKTFIGRFVSNELVFNTTSFKCVLKWVKHIDQFFIFPLELSWIVLDYVQTSS
jgi:hypothetical protein